MEIVQLTLSKAEEQPCFLQAASHWSFIGSDHERPSNEEQEAGGDLGYRAEWKRGRQSGCTEKGEYQGESLYGWASVSLVYTCSNYVVRIFGAFWVFFWKLYCFYGTDVFPLLSGKTLLLHSKEEGWSKQTDRPFLLEAQELRFPFRCSVWCEVFPHLLENQVLRWIWREATRKGPVSWRLWSSTDSSSSLIWWQNDWEVLKYTQGMWKSLYSPSVNYYIQ